jgi:hypothetical protein
MKDGLDPLGSATAAYLNNLEQSGLNDLGDVAQKIISLTGKLSIAAIKLALPGVPDVLLEPAGRLSEWLIDTTVKTKKANVETFAYLVVTDLNLLGRHIDDLSNPNRNLALFLQGANKARVADNADKVRRLAQVVLNGVVSENDPEEKVNEFIRFAAELNETDIHVLKVLYDRQSGFNPKFVAEWAQNVRRSMHDYPIPDSSGGTMDDQYVRSAYARLQALGLAVQLGGTASDTSPAEQHYALLKLGKEFFQYLEKQ